MELSSGEAGGEICPAHDARCNKLAAKAIVHFNKGGGDLILDPVLGGLKWRFGRREAEHYGHIEAAVRSAGIAVEQKVRSGDLGNTDGEIKLQHVQQP